MTGQRFLRVLSVSALPPERSSMRGRILPLARAAADVGHTVTVLTLSGRTAEPFAADRMDHGVHLREVGPALRATETEHPTFTETLARLRAGRTALAQALRAERADVAVLAKPQFQNTPPVLAWARENRIPLLLDVDDLEAEASRLPLPARWYARFLERSAGARAALITACSPYLVEHFKRVNPRARVELLPTGIEIPSEVPPARLRERLGLPPDAKIILYVGSLSISSGHRLDLLLQAFEQLTTHYSLLTTHLVLAGSGLDEARLRQLSTLNFELGTRIHFLGRFDPPEDLALARESDLLVDPVDRTPTNEAKSSHRVMLALATGTPMVAGDLGIRSFLLPRSLHDVCLYDPSEPGALLEALHRGLDPALRDRFRKETAGRITQWTWPVLGSRFGKLLADCSSAATGSSMT